MAYIGKRGIVLSVLAAVLVWAFRTSPGLILSPQLREWKQSGKFFSHGEFKVFYHDETGKGEAGEVVLCIHGFPSSSHDWVKVWDGLQGRFGRVIASDLLGFGFSDKPLDHNYSIFEQASIIEQLLETLEVKEVYILSHDYGDTVALELLRRFLDRQKSSEKSAAHLRIRSVCLMNGGFLPETITFQWVQYLLTTSLGPYLSRLSNFLPFTFKQGLFWSVLKRATGKGKTGIPSLSVNGKAVGKDKDKAEVFNNTFVNVTKATHPDRIRRLPKFTDKELSAIQVSEEEVLDVLKELHSNKAPGPDAAVFLDVRRAFDTVWHDGLVYKLSRYGVVGTLNMWFGDYLSGRQQRTLRWTEHAQLTSNKARRTLGLLWKLRGKLSQEALELAYFTLIRPKLEYASVLLTNLTVAASKTLERVQYHAGRLVTGAAPRTPYSEVLQKLGISKVYGPDTKPSPAEYDDHQTLLRWNDGHLAMGSISQYQNERVAHRERWVEAVQQSTIPVHLIYGPADPVNTPVLLDRYRELFPRATDTVLNSKIGHYPHVEDPQSVLTAFFNFLEKVASFKQSSSPGKM
ncbi:mesoderm-specific transcript homolog protein-like [Branchiostoma floridae]|uniref:Mesoderm-specific transcript homolog protein-like n=1 Tax=Branchiostoma floridae TaxID=7739 RepID=A0A9J7L673_BRAFL|nr:mesoderm-specific transcript homolog protein-like [Branchiostoma floridae]